MAAKRLERRRSPRWPLRRRSRHPACSLTADCLAQSAEAADGASAVGSTAGAGIPVSPLVSPAPEPQPGVYSDGRLPGASAEAAAGASAVGSAAGTGMAASRVATPAPESAPSVYSDGGPSGVSTGAAAHTARDSVHSRHQSPPRRHIPAAVRRHVWQRDGGRCCYRDPLTGRRCTSSHLLQIDHLLPVAQGGGANLFNLTYAFSALPNTACATAMGRLCRRNAPCSTSSALLARRSTRLADGLQVDVAGRGTLRISARRSVHLRRRIIRPWPWSTVYEPPASGDRHHRQRSALQHR